MLVETLLSIRKYRVVAKAKFAGAEKSVEIDGLELRIIEIDIQGLTALIQHRWSTKARDQIRNKQTGHGTAKKGPKDIEADFVDSTYFIKKVFNGDGTVDWGASIVGFPTVAFKAAAASAFNFVHGMKKAVIRGAFHIINGEETEDGSLVPIYHPNVPRMREDMVRIFNGTADMRHRPEFMPWSTRLTCEYNDRVITPSTLFNLFQHAGFSVGVGEWRPEKDGDYGRFKVGA